MNDIIKMTLFEEERFVKKQLIKQEQQWMYTVTYQHFVVVLLPLTKSLQYGTVWQ